MSTAPRPQPEKLQDPIKVDPKHYTVEHEDARVRVLRIRYAAHEKSTMHSHPALVAVFLTDGHFRFTYPDGKSEDIRCAAGEVKSFAAQSHLPENLSDRAFEAIAIELKS